MADVPIEGRPCRFRGGPQDGQTIAVYDAMQVLEFIEFPNEPPRILPPDTTPPGDNWPPRHRYRRSAVRNDLFVYDGQADMAKREIEFTQYLLPDGRRQTVRITVPHDVAEKVDHLRAHQIVPECEVLRTGAVSLTLADKHEECDVAIRVVANGPEVPEAVEDLIREFDLKGYIQ